MTTTKHTLYAVSTGPSGSKYLTQEAIAVITSCNTIFYPVTPGGTNPHIAFDCIKQAVDVSRKQCVGVTFSMSRNEKTTEQEYETVVNQVSQALTHGDVAFIAIGDISIYSTAARVADIMQSKGMNTQFVSGVPSFCVAAGSLKLDLAQTDEEIRIIPGDAYFKMKARQCSGRRRNKNHNEIRPTPKRHTACNCTKRHASSCKSCP